MSRRPFFAQAPRTAALQDLLAGLKIGFYEKGDVRIRYAEIGSGFAVAGVARPRLELAHDQLAACGDQHHGGFKSDFRVIAMDQRNATNGESAGPVPMANPWDAFADDQLGLMDHLGIRQFLFFGNCMGGPFAMKLRERALQPAVAAILSQPVGHRPDKPDYMYESGRDVWAKEFLGRQPDVSIATIEQHLHNRYPCGIRLRV